MKTLILLLVSFIFAGQVSAETNWVSDEIQEEILEETGKTKKASGNIYIVNQNKGQNDNAAEAKNINKGEVSNEVAVDAKADNQPETIVEASPLVQSYANNLRSQRQRAEIQTEQKIVEKLEAARLEDERSRAQRLFGHKKFSNDHKPEVVHEKPPVVVKQEVAAPVVVATPPVVTQAPATPVYSAPAPVVVSEVVYETVPHTKPKKLSKAYATVGLGGLSYKAKNVESKYAWDLGVGIMLDDNISVEASMMYSQHRVDELYGYQSRIGSYGFTDLDQFNWGLEARYNLPVNKFNLYVGAYGAYVKRSYHGKSNGHHNIHHRGKKTEESTSAWNIAPVIGAEMSLTKKISLGLDYRYMKNFAQSFSSDDMKHSHRDFDESPLEEIDYSVISGRLKFNF